MLSLVGLVFFALSSCTTDNLVNDGNARTVESAYGNYLAGRYASAMNDVRAAADYYAAAQEKEPQNSLLRRHAFLSALLAGDIPDSAVFARPALGGDDEAPLMRLSVASFDLGSNRFASAQVILSNGNYGPFNNEVRHLLNGWTAYGVGDNDKALVLIGSASDVPIFASIVQLHTALMLDLAGRVDEAETAYKSATGPSQLSDRAAFAYGGFLERLGRINEAREQYTKAIAAFPEAPLSSAALVRLDARPRAKLPPRLVNNARDGAAEALFGTAQVLAAQAHFDKALVYLEMARFINPDNGAAVQLLARLMEATNRPDDALATFDSIAKTSPYRLDADLHRARVLFRLKRNDEAMVIFKSLAKAHPKDDRLIGVYADALRSMEDYETVLPIYEGLIARAGDEANWQIYFARGTVLERLGRWRESIVDFRKALTLNPDQPDVLNYLGYTYVDAGENLDEGFAMIEKALSLRPEAGYIVDSLGWAHYRLGHYEQAVRYLERAVELEPGEPTISDHLADAYWQADRRLEARFQWNHTLSLEPDDDIDLVAVKDKLAHGLRDKPEIATANP